MSRTAVILSGVLADRNVVERYRGRVDLAFLGYSNDPRELRDIPEVRRFCSTLDDAFPYWFYFLSTEGVLAPPISLDSRLAKTAGPERKGRDGPEAEGEQGDRRS